MELSTEQRILEIARKQFVRNGFAATRMQEIADEAGINKAMLHYYFRKKDKLYEEVISATLDQMIPRFAKAMEYEGNFFEKLEHIVDAYINMLIEHPDVPMFIMGELSQKRERFVTELKKRSSYFPAIQSFMLQMMQEMGEGKIRQVAPLHMLLNIMGMTVFPFIAKPIFCTINDFPEDEYESLMRERKEIIVDFIKHSLRPEKKSRKR